MGHLLEKVAITGGTHGNELTGVYLVKRWLANPEKVKRDSFSTELYLANPEAIWEVRRYIDQDLNRQFSLPDLRDTALTGSEQQRAKALDKLLGPKEDPRIDFIIDLHTTTANMGVSLIFNTDDPLVVGMAFYIKQQMPEAELFYSPSDRMEDNYLRSMGRFGGLVIEVGPIAQGLLNHAVYSDTHTAVLHALDYLHKKNCDQAMSLPESMPAYKFIEKIPLPVNPAGDICAMIHPDRQDKDFQPIEPGDPLFITLADETICYQGEHTVYGAFINEAAYYDRNIGLSVMERVAIRLESP